MHRIVCAKSNSEKTREKIVRRQAMPNVGKCKVIKSWAKTSSSCPLLLLLRRRNEVNFHSLDQDARIETVLMRAKMEKNIKGIIFLLFLLVLASEVRSLPKDQFYPFGANHGDAHLPKDVEDVSSPEVKLKTAIKFFTREYVGIYVSSMFPLCSGVSPEMFEVIYSKHLCCKRN